MKSAKLPPKIVVITPVRNEAWILPMFLSTCSTFADHILILDQASTDGSREICRKFPKVTLLDNPSPNYNEAERQTLLIEAARKLVPQPRFLLALDADEPLAADAATSKEWDRILNAPPGTSVFFNKVHFVQDPEVCLPESQTYPFGFMDNDQPHQPLLIHSKRLPIGSQEPINLPEMKVLHYGLTRPKHQLAKMRMYCCLEKVYKTSKWHWRRLFYNQEKDYRKDTENSQRKAEWIDGWERMGIKMAIPADTELPWMDLEVLRLVGVHGAHTFWSEPIWDHDWESARLQAVAMELEGIQSDPVAMPPLFYQQLLKKFDRVLSAIRVSRRTIVHLLFKTK